MKKIIIIGAGAMGSAFAVPCLENGNDVTIVGTHLEDKLIEKIESNKKIHPSLNTKLPNALKIRKFHKLKSILNPGGVALILAYDTETLNNEKNKKELLENPMATNFTSEKFFRLVCDEFDFKSYNRIKCYAEKNSSFHILRC